MIEENKTNKSGVHYYDDLYYGDINPEDFIIAGKRLGIMKGDDGAGNEWWVTISPRNHNFCAEGDWSDFVELAKLILKRDEELLKETK